MHARPTAEAPAELMIYGRIGGGGFFSEGIGAADVAAMLREAGPGPINVRLNSPGGDVFDGVAIHSLLARHPGTVTVYVDGLAASAASFIMLAADRIVSARNAFIMIHDAMTGTYGNGDTHRQAAELLDKVSGNIADMYTERAGEDVDHWRAAMTVNGEDGTWYTGQEALDAGLVDELTEVTDETTAAYLDGWSGVLKADALAFLEAHPPKAEDQDSTITHAQSMAAKTECRYCSATIAPTAVADRWMGLDDNDSAVGPCCSDGKPHEPITEDHAEPGMAFAMLAASIK